MCPSSRSPDAALRSTFSDWSTSESETEYQIVNTSHGQQQDATKALMTSEVTLPLTSEFWLQFQGQGFDPNPKAPFSEEFDRLAKQKGWSEKTKSSQRVAAFSAEISFHWNDSTVLRSWQALCVVVGVAVQPSISKCKVVGGLLAVDISKYPSRPAYCVLTNLIRR
jgi:hypothetical protein